MAASGRPVGCAGRGMRGGAVQRADRTFDAPGREYRACTWSGAAGAGSARSRGRPVAGAALSAGAGKAALRRSDCGRRGPVCASPPGGRPLCCQLFRFQPDGAGGGGGLRPQGCVCQYADPRIQNAADRHPGLCGDAAGARLQRGGTAEIFTDHCRRVPASWRSWRTTPCC